MAKIGDIEIGRGGKRAPKRSPYAVGRGGGGKGVGPYTDSRMVCKDSGVTDAAGNPREKPRQEDVDAPSRMTKRTIAPITGAPGLAAKLPKVGGDAAARVVRRGDVKTY
jgi:hypothetical protein